jgi:hypothetical protein
MRILVLATIFASCVFAQLDSNTITISASRAIYVQPDEIAIGVYVDTGPDVTLDQVLAVLQPAGITSGNFSSVYPVVNILLGGLGVTGATGASGATGPIAFVPQDGLEWAFTINVTFASMKNQLNQLASVQKTLALKPGTILSFGPQGLHTSTAALATQPCRTLDLMNDARAQALALANAAGFSIGPVVAMSDGGAISIRGSLPQTISPSPIYSPLPAGSAFPVFSFLSFGSTINNVLTPSPSTCAIVVKFRLMPP